MENLSPSLFDVFFLLSQLMNFLVVNVHISHTFISFVISVLVLIMSVSNCSNLVLLEISFIIHSFPFVSQLMFFGMEHLPSCCVVFGMVFFITDFPEFLTVFIGVMFVLFHFMFSMSHFMYTFIEIGSVVTF